MDATQDHGELVRFVLARLAEDEREERAPVPFPEKAALIRREAEEFGDEDTLRLVASVYDAHPDWLESWRP